MEASMKTPPPTTNMFSDSTGYAWPHLQKPVRIDADAHKACGSLRGDVVHGYQPPLSMCRGRAGSAFLSKVPLHEQI